MVNIEVKNIVLIYFAKFLNIIYNLCKNINAYVRNSVTVCLFYKYDKNNKSRHLDGCSIGIQKLCLTVKVSN